MSHYPQAETHTTMLDHTGMLAPSPGKMDDASRLPIHGAQPVGR
jgi:hypothetical protein